MSTKILIIDDDQEHIDFASALLDENGYLPIGAMNGKEGMEKALTEKPDLILLDIMMPEKGGVSTYRELKLHEQTAQIPVIIVTGVSRGERFEERILGLGSEIPPPDAYMEKPMRPDTIIGLVNEILSPP